ncbi:protein of unknown function [Dethiosulfatibacter aminovorans DSM 17477]|uniref:Bacteriocin-protection, YdeI or OmpD-Associated n=1 Tax=Dethiosulfatibacter aminovorans DSM 17477 TaxID=1121476 RepID=A0A1M6MDY1_9FIRM|nr:YdeI/OmpD-associated family protein [Dethiosulfatibacter aminovorans]SHJ81657.1 protein of unknown function [Dethiosulfatibacter aminovorans DSM 17477]
MTVMKFEAELLGIKGWLIIRIPADISEMLPSRGMVMAEVEVKSERFEVPLEPDGEGSHWFKVDEALFQGMGLAVGDVLFLSIKPLKDWSEPVVPSDLNDSLDLFDVKTQWDKITVKARWEWIRWIRDTNNPQTREKRIETACSMLAAGKKRPCCFNNARCTEAYVSKNGVLDVSNN